MDSKLVEEIEEYLKRHKEQLPDFARETQLTRLLQRCLESLRWIPFTEKPSEKKMYLCKQENGHIESAYWNGRFFAESWGSQRVHVTHWLHIPQ